MTIESIEVTYNESSRPQLHYSPPNGFMNDPNGMVYANGRYHLYFQYNPKGMTAGQPHWGHATSLDMVHWTNHDIAIYPVDDREGVFSGSAVVDFKNTSGLFDERETEPENRIVAIFTSHTPEKQTQNVAYSTDGGFTFTRYQGNPVVDIDSKEFRDPRVFFHEPSNKWVMLVAKSQDYEIAFYTSSNLLDWRYESSFTGGLVGYQYEVPDLVELPIESEDPSEEQKYQWVLFVSVNPGSPLGGSATQYFIGAFDGRRFLPQDNVVRMADHGKDWYASQTFTGTARGDVYGLAWASNWQYTNQVPTYPWRSCMSVVRKMSLKRTLYNKDHLGLLLKQTPILPSREAIPLVPIEADNGDTIHCQNHVGSFDVNIRAVGAKPQEKIIDPCILKIKLSSSCSTNYDYGNVVMGLRVFETGAHWYIDRGTAAQTDWYHPLFNEKISTYVQADDIDLPSYNLRCVIDRGIIETFINDGTVSFTNTYFLPDGVIGDCIEIQSGDEFSVTGGIRSLASCWVK